jgi:urease accessory protein
MGTRLVRTWLHIYADAALSEVLERQHTVTLPAAFGVVSACSGVTQVDAVCGYAYTRLAAAVSAAMRLMPLGQHDAHAQLAAVLARVPETAAAVVEGRSPLTSFAPAIDIAQMRHQYEHSRLFRS